MGLAEFRPISTVWKEESKPRTEIPGTGEQSPRGGAANRKMI